MDLLKFWGKLSNNQTHPLIFHSIDIGNVTSTIWNNVFSPTYRSRLANRFGLNEDDTGRCFAFWASLHDIGKLTPAFQSKVATTLQSQLKDEGFDFPLITNSPSHSYLSTRILTDWLRTQCSESSINNIKRNLFPRILGGHHGIFPIGHILLNINENHLGRSPKWQQAREELIKNVAFLFNEPPYWDFCNQIDAGTGIILAGLICVADWIGSNEDYFPFTKEPVSIQNYFALSQEKARQALERTGWTPTRILRQAPSSFEKVFSGKSPRQLQKQIIDLFSSKTIPDFLLLEWPTGEGKTESAFWAATHWLKSQEQKGLYVALPTRATSDQMWMRTDDFLGSLFLEPNLKPALIHGLSQLVKDELPKININDEDTEDDTNVEVADWFSSNKKLALLPPFGVGTIDQALTSVLQVRHFFLRLFGLAGKTVILDEVHAYDTYTNDLLIRLLEWLRALDTRVILLSATLPAEKRQELIQAYVGKKIEIPKIQYPATIYYREDKIFAEHLPPTNLYSLDLGWVNGPEPDLSAWLEEQLSKGGCAAIIHNTVGRAQSTYDKLAKSLPDDVDIHLLHSRFPYEDRKKIEDKLLGLYGPPDKSNRPQKSILIATQVIEQSLDLDFDVMVSDLAPIDLLLQRAGRLHRHERGVRLHPRKLWIVEPELKDEVPQVRQIAEVYDEYIILKTWRELKRKNHIAVPEDVSHLIDQVYSSLELSNDTLGVAIKKAHDKHLIEVKEHLLKSKLVQVEKPDNLENVLKQNNTNLIEDDPTAHHTLQAATRLTSPSIEVICLREEVPEEKALFEQIVVGKDMHRGQINKLLKRSLSVSNRWLVARILGSPDRKISPDWDFSKSPLRKTPLLRFHIPLLFKDGVNKSFTGFTLRLSEELGLTIETNK